MINITVINVIQTSSINSILSINNPLANSTSLSTTINAGGNLGVSAHLIIKRIT